MQKTERQEGFSEEFVIFAHLFLRGFLRGIRAVPESVRSEAWRRTN